MRRDEKRWDEMRWGPLDPSGTDCVSISSVSPIPLTPFILSLAPFTPSPPPNHQVFPPRNPRPRCPRRARPPQRQARPKGGQAAHVHLLPDVCAHGHWDRSGVCELPRGEGPGGGPERGVLHPSTGDVGESLRTTPSHGESDMYVNA